MAREDFFCNYCQKYLGLVTSSKEKTSCEYPNTQSLQHTKVYCWWKLVINYLYSTNLVYYGITVADFNVIHIKQKFSPNYMQLDEKACRFFVSYNQKPPTWSKGGKRGRFATGA